MPRKRKDRINDLDKEMSHIKNLNNEIAAGLTKLQVLKIQNTIVLMGFKITYMVGAYTTLTALLISIYNKDLVSSILFAATSLYCFFSFIKIDFKKLIGDDLGER